MPVNQRHVIKPIEIARDVFSVIFDQAESPESFLASNQGFVILEDSVLLFDTGFSSRYARLLDIAISAITDKKIRYIVNSHDHSDHILGNSYFSKKYSTSGLSIISHELCAQIIRSIGTERIQKYKKSYNKLAPSLTSRVEIPNVTYESGFNLNIEGAKFVFIHPNNGAHTLGDTMLAMPHLGVILMGDVFVNSFFPNIEDANLEEWVRTLNLMDHTTYSKFLPGHGTVGGRAEVSRFADYLRDLSRRLLLLEEPDRAVIQSCFETESTRNWSCRFLVHWNCDYLLGRSKSAITKV
ncbi:MAG: MBL fold metallo-hydrolase [Nitrososphaerota archaeon]|nr:MBL fold metallo-hydrolase [Nitrososphaerota archaeon]